MDINKLEKIKMSLMIMEGEPALNEKDHYIKKATGEFQIPEDFYKNLKKEEQLDLTSGLVNAIYDELMGVFNNEDHLGMWVDYDGETKENAIQIDVLKDMGKYGAEDVDPIFEFFKMTINK